MWIWLRLDKICTWLTNVWFAVINNVKTDFLVQEWKWSANAKCVIRGHIVALLHSESQQTLRTWTLAHSWTLPDFFEICQVLFEIIQTNETEKVGLVGRWSCYIQAFDLYKYLQQDRLQSTVRWDWSRFITIAFAQNRAWEFCTSLPTQNFGFIKTTLRGEFASVPKFSSICTHIFGGIGGFGNTDGEADLSHLLTLPPPSHVELKHIPTVT